MDADSLRPALDGVTSRSTSCTRSTTPTSSARTPQAARNFSAAAAAAGAQPDRLHGRPRRRRATTCSAHLRSRREVEGLLGTDGVPVTVLRAAIVVGHGGISWELTRQLVKNLPAMVVPKWVGTRTQPISIDDVVRYLAGVVGKEEALGRVFEIGGPEQLTYREMLQGVALAMNGRSCRSSSSRC